MKFSVLMAVYKKEKPQNLNKALLSVYTGQSLKPNEIVLVKDGALTKELDNVIRKWEAKIPDVLKVVKLEKNGGLANALNEGLKKCSFEYVARMDSDDISYPNRFEKEISFLKKNPDIDVLGGWITEFEKDEKEICCDRKVPISSKDILHFSKNRCPVNHVTVIYKKSKVLEVGGYDKFIGIEDYYLWAKMLLKGHKFFNLPEYLVHVRAGEGMLERRRGISYAKKEFLLQFEFYKMGFISFPIFVKNTFIKFLIRLAPVIFIKKVYRSLRKENFRKVAIDRNIYFRPKYREILYGENR